MSEALKILQELRANKRYSYMYDRIDTAIKDLLAQPEQEPIAYVADPSVGFDVSRSAQGMPLIWLGKLEYGDTLYRVRFGV